MKKHLTTPFRFFLVTAAAAMFAGCSSQAEPAKTPPPKTVSWFALEAGDYVVERRLSGVVRPARTADLSFEVPGKVSEVSVELGDRFTSGDVLARLDDRVYRLAVEQRKSELSEAEAQLVKAKNDYARNRELLERGAVSESTYDTVRARYQSAKDKVAIAKTRLSLAREDLADTRIVAPYDGEVSARSIEPSQQVSVGSPAFQIQGTRALEISLFVPETMIGRIDRGQRASLRFPALTDIDALGAVVTEIGTRAVRANAFPATLTLDRQHEALRPGMTAEAAFALTQPLQPESGVFRIPVTAFHADSGQGHFVYRIAPEHHTLVRIPVRVKEMARDHAFVEGALSSGDLLVKAGLSFLHEGQQVKPMGRGVRAYNP